MNKNIDMDNFQFRINELQQEKHKKLQKIEQIQREIHQIDLNIIYIYKDNCEHELVKSPEIVYTEGKDCGELIAYEEWCCVNAVNGNRCLYKELRGVE